MLLDSSSNRTLVADTNALRQPEHLLERLCREDLQVPVVVVQELLYQLSRPKHQGPARAALRFLSRARPTLIPDHDELVCRAFGIPAPFWQARARSWWIIIDMAAAGLGWPGVRSAWNVFASRERYSSTADAFRLWKETGCFEFASEMRALVERERTIGESSMEHVAHQQGRDLSDQDRRDIRRHLRESVTALEFRRAWLFNQLAALARVVRLPEALEATRSPEASFIATYESARLRYRGGLDFALALYEHAHDAWVTGASVDRNDFIDIMILLAVGDSNNRLFVTQECAWHRAAMASGLDSRVVRIQDL